MTRKDVSTMSGAEVASRFRNPARAQIDAGMSEDDLLTAIVEAALFLGWRVHHDRRSDLARQQGSPGFPDLVLARRGRIYFVECKTTKGSVTPDQLAWAQATVHNWWTVRPADLDDLLETLARP